MAEKLGGSESAFASMMTRKAKQLGIKPLGVFRAFVTVGVLIVTGFDKRVETILVEASPTWLTQLTTRY